MFMQYEATRDAHGLSSGQMYFGRKGSTFSWHTEPANIPSFSTLHAGAPKIWYSVPSRYTETVKNIAWPILKKLRGYSYHDCFAFFEHRWTHQNPMTFMKLYKIPVSVAVQVPGVSVLVPKNTLHWGHSVGWNIGEAIGCGTIPLAEDYAKNGEPPSCERQDAGGNPLLLVDLIKHKDVFDSTQRAINRNVCRGPGNPGKAKCRLFQHVKGGFR